MKEKKLEREIYLELPQMREFTLETELNGIDTKIDGEIGKGLYFTRYFPKEILEPYKRDLAQREGVVFQNADYIIGYICKPDAPTLAPRPAAFVAWSVYDDLRYENNHIYYSAAFVFPDFRAAGIYDRLFKIRDSLAPIDRLDTRAHCTEFSLGTFLRYGFKVASASPPYRVEREAKNTSNEI